MIKTKLERANELAIQIEQMQARKKELLQGHNQDLRKARTHRICKRGAMIESILPETVELTDEEIKALLEKMLKSQFVRNRLDEIQGTQTAPVKSVPTKPVPNTVCDNTSSQSTSDESNSD